MRASRKVIGSALALALVATASAGSLLTTADPVAADDALGREAVLTPEQLGTGGIDGLQFADPTEGLSLIDPPVANTGGSAQLSYPLLFPPGRGITPELALTYDSGGGNGWLGVGWDLSVDEVSVDTTFGAPHFDADLESESYLLDGDLLVPNALGEAWEPRSDGDREDWTRQVETSYERIIRHGDNPKDYYWEVYDKQGNVRWYGGHPDVGGPEGGLTSQGGIDRSAIVTDQDDNAVRWLLSAQRDVGVNLIQYHYTTIEYADGDSGWQVTSDCTESDTTVCGEHTYLSSIDYTAAAEVSGQPADPAYEVIFELEDVIHRSDPVVDASLGYVDVLVKRLAKVEVNHGAPDGGAARDHDNVAVRYEFAYEQGSRTPFEKSLLTSVTQSGGTADTAVHTFAYHNEVGTRASSYGGFGDSATWNTGDDLRTRSMLDENVSPGAMGASESNSAEGHAYLGFNPLIPDKNGSFGGSLQIGGGNTQALAEWLDINGDSLPDKVWKQDGELRYRLNTSGPAGGTTFEDPEDIEEIGTLSNDNNIGVQGGVEVNLGVTASFGLGLEVAWGDSYFTDVNADGLPDLVSGGKVFFNHLDGDDRPTFSEDSASTLVPLPTGGGTPSADSDLLTDMQADLDRRSPTIDTVRRWVAPYTGTVTIDAPVTLSPTKGDSKDGVRVAIQVAGREVATANLGVPGSTAFGTALSEPVTAGDPVYFRLGSVNDGANDEVEWSPTITYTAIADHDVATLPTDVNGLSQTTFALAEDFTLAGRPDSGVVMPYTGEVEFTADIVKSAVTTDDLALVLEHNGTIVEDSDITIDADFIGTTPVSLTFPVTQPTLPDPDNPDTPVPAPDTVEAHLAVDTPIDISTISWDPTLTYTSATDRDGGAMDVVDDDGEPIIQVGLIPNIDIYPQQLHPDAAAEAGPSEPWTATATGTFDARVSLSLAEKHPGGRVLVSVKTRDGVVEQVPWIVGASTGGGTVTETVQLNAGLSSGTAYWVEVTMTDPQVSLKTTLDSFALRPDGAPDGAGDIVVAPAVRVSGQQGIFPLPYRGWGVAGYTAGGDLATDPIVHEAFVIDTDALKEGGAKPDGFDDLPADAGDPEPSYAYLPVNNPPTLDEDLPDSDVSAQFGPLAGPLWQGSRENLAANADRMRSSRLGADSIALTQTGGTGRAVTRVSITAPQAALAIGAGPLGASFGMSPSFGLQDYEDLNGDGYPDVITPGSVHYTTQRGAFADSATSINDGLMAVTNQDLTMSVEGGLSQGLVDISANNKGRTNATKGSAAGKGGDAGDSSGGVEIGLDIGASWTSPNASGADDEPIVGTISSNPSDEHGDAVEEAGAEATEEGARISQELADVNGDGLPDRVYTTSQGVFAHYNLGYGFTEGAVYLGTGGFESMESYSSGVNAGFSTPLGEFSGGVAFSWNYDLARYTWTDVNGDGILDQVHKLSQGASPVVRFGTGSGLTPAVSYGDMQSAAAAMGVPTGPNASFDRSSGIGGGFDFTVYVGPLCLVACYLVINPGASYQNSLSSTEVALEDVNGDGFADSVATTADEELKVSLNNHGRTNLLQEVVNPLGGTMTLDYARDGNTIAHPGSVFTMTSVTLDDGRDSAGDGVDVLAWTYDYEGLDYDRAHRQSLGFATILEHEMDATTGTAIRTTTRRFLNDNVFVAGLEWSTLRTDAQADPLEDNLSGATMTWGFRDAREEHGDVHAPVSPVATISDLRGIGSLGRSIAPLLLSVTEEFYDWEDIGQQTETTFVYDALGNVLEQLDRGELEDATDDVLTRHTYSTCEISSSVGCLAQPALTSPLWDEDVCATWVSLPAVVTETNNRTGADEVVYRHRDGRTDLCDNASVTHLEETVDDGDVAVTDLTYDSWGSYDRIVYPEGADGVRYAVKYVWDADRHSNIAQVTDYDFDSQAAVDAFLEDDDPSGALRTGLTATATFDPLSGRVTSRTDANNNTSHYGYDAFGRVISISIPGSTQDLVTFDYAPSAPAYGYAIAHHTDQFNPGDTIDTITFVDGLGRETQTKRDATLHVATGQPGVAARVVSGVVEYDALGRVVTEHYPTADQQAGLTAYDTTAPDPAAATTTVLDLWDAPNEVTEPGDRVTTTEYLYEDIGDGTVVFATTTTDPRGRQTTTWTDMREQVLRIDDAPADEVALTSWYDYNGLGELLSFTDSAGEVTTHSYDMLGRHTTTDTPDGGLVTMAYDDEGKLTSRVSPNLRAAEQETTYAYRLGKLVGIDHPTGTPDVSYTYGDAGADGNGAGRVTRIEDGTRIVDLTYSAGGSVVEQAAQMKLHNWDPARAEDFTWTTSWSFDGLGRIASMTYPDGERLTYDYDSGGLVREVVGEEDGYEDIITGYDEFGDPIWERVPRTWEYDYVLNRTYDEFLARRSTTYGNEVSTEWSYQATTRWLDRQQTISPHRNVTDPAYQEIQDLNYAYDVVGNVQEYRNDLPEPLSSQFGGATVQTYELDGYDRLVGAHGEWRQDTKSTRVYDLELEYDEHRNVIGKTQRDVINNGKKDLVQKDTTYSFDRDYSDAAPGLATSAGPTTYHYDANGNLLGTKDSRGKWIRELTWDATDRLTVVNDASNETTFRYDDTGQRMIERGPSGETAFVNPWVTVRNGTEIYKHIWIDEERIATQRDDGGAEELKRYFLHQDLQGSTNIVSDYRGDTFQHQEYFPGGEVWIAENSTVFRTPYQFGGHYDDEQRDLLGVGERWYDSRDELMYSPDSLLVEDPLAVIEQPELRAAYSFAGANPISNVDPSGQMFITTQAQAEMVKAADKAVRAKLKDNPDVAASIAASLDSKLPRSFVKLALDTKRAESLQAFADKFEPNAFIDIDLSAGTVKIGAPYGKRLTLGGSDTPTDATSTSPPARPASPAPGGPSTVSSTTPSTTSSTSPQAPQRPGGGTGNSPGGADSSTPAPTKPKPLPKPAAKTSVSDQSSTRSGE
ncbi:SpvB/TcaC N-terminal domain-containing protein [Ornithinimicrobium cavernae]|uniref:SpvB/TcaC N-terminal domain-containing protein n=1 Tax=Ornithinimicrobium cavernae TaxID=2666047 RepID=UPI0012B185EA|nr:SpvB/TcaC N-terminal domain-containing protein [Ornithinimicrobium cavernae]